VQLEWIDSRQLVAPAVEIGKSQPGYEIIDQRSITQMTPTLLEQWTQPDFLIWREGKALSQFTGVARSQLAPAHTLVIATIPPGPTELTDVLDFCRPSQVILLGLDPGTDQMDEFLKFLIGLVRYRLKNNQPTIDLRELTAACGQREVTVQKGLEWLKENGTLRYDKVDSTNYLIAEDGTKDTNRLKVVDAELRQLLKETAAYRAYYLRADASQLLPAKGPAMRDRKK
jgi:hypothetical protein